MTGFQNEFSDSIKSGICVIFGDFPALQEVMDRLLRRELKVTHTHSLKKLIELLDKNLVSILILSDCPTLPCFYSLRVVLAQKVGQLIPILTVANIRDKLAQKCLESMNHRANVSQRDYNNPANIVSELRLLGQQWSTPAFLQIVKARRLISKNRFLEAIEEIRSVSYLEVFPNPLEGAVAKILLLEKRYPHAESVLLEALKLKRVNLRLLFSLLDLYFEASLIGMVEKILDKMRECFGSYIGFSVDVLQMHLLNGDYESAIPLLKDLIQFKFCHRLARENLAKIYYLCGDLRRLGEMDREALKALDRLQLKLTA